MEATECRSFRRLPTIDGYKRLGINSINSGAYLSDGKHLNDFGRRQFGELIGGHLVKIGREINDRLRA